MKLTTMTQVTLDGMTQGNGPMDVDHGNGFERGGWAMAAGDNQNDFVDEMTLLIVPVVLGQGARLFPDSGSDIALDLAGSQADSKGVTVQVYRQTGRPQYATG